MMRNMHSYFANEKDGLAKVDEGGFAMIMDRINLEYYAAKNCSYTLLGDAMTQVTPFVLFSMSHRVIIVETELLITIDFLDLHCLHG